MVRETRRKAQTVAGDATQSAIATEVVDRTIAHLGGLHILVNNAGMELPKPLIETSEDEYDRVMNTNVKSMVLFTQTAGRHLIAQRFGRIVNMASVGAFVAAPNQEIYHASKAAVAHLTKATAIEWARYGITVNAVAPGWVRTELIRHLLDDQTMLSGYTKAIPMRRIAEPEEIAPLVALVLGFRRLHDRIGGRRRWRADDTLRRNVHERAAEAARSVVAADLGLTVPPSGPMSNR